MPNEWVMVVIGVIGLVIGMGGGGWLLSVLTRNKADKKDTKA